MIIRRLTITLVLVSISDAGFFSDLVSNLKGNSNSGSNSGGGGGISHGHSNKFNVAPVSEDKAKDYLQDFGYISPTNLQTGGMAGDFDVGSMIKKAVTKFQEFAGLAKTGILDSVTRKKMAMPRCGFTDAPLAITASGGSSGFKWKKSHITYSFESYTPDLDRDTVKRAIREAYGKWSAVAPISFEEVPQGRGDIKIKFGTKNHGDPWPFDGDGGVLAHATMPENGALHFDDDEKWAYKDANKIGSDYTDILAVAIHEGGHTLGLEHSRNDKAIMAPFYQSTVDSSGRYIAPELTSDDISAIQDIYGRGSGSSSSSSGSSSSGSSWGGSSGRLSPTTQSPWGGSNSNGWGNSNSGSGSNWGDSGSRQRGSQWGSDWENRNPGWNSGQQGSNSGSSWGGGSSFTTTARTTTTTRRPSSPWGGSASGSGTSLGGTDEKFGSSAGCPRSVDTYTPSTSFSYLFEGSKVYTISGQRVIKSQPIRDLFQNAPSSVQGAVWNPISGRVVLFSGSQVYGYLFNRHSLKFDLDNGFPKQLPRDVPFRPTGALRWVNGHQVVLSESGQFVVYDENWNKVTLTSRIDNYFENLPYNVKGTELAAGMSLTGFTSNSVFTYDSRAKRVTNETPLSRYLQC